MNWHLDEEPPPAGIAAMGPALASHSTDPALTLCIPSRPPQKPHLAQSSGPQLTCCTPGRVSDTLPSPT